MRTRNEDDIMRQPRFRLRTIMIGIAFLALIMTVIVQTVLLQRAAVREEMFRAEMMRERAVAEMLAHPAPTAAAKTVAPAP
jgi:NhaP-type Na+/H+ or K+/H+ antiporter